jgi:hypothetical protein
VDEASLNSQFLSVLLYVLEHERIRERKKRKTAQTAFSQTASLMM